VPLVAILGNADCADLYVLTLPVV